MLRGREEKSRLYQYSLCSCLYLKSHPGLTVCYKDQIERADK